MTTPHIPQSKTEQLVIARLFEVEVFGKPFPVVGRGGHPVIGGEADEYEAVFIHGPQKTSVDGELVASPLWDSRGRYYCYVDVRRKEPHLHDLLDGDLLPVVLWVEEGHPGIQIHWAMAANAWTDGKQSNRWPSPPVLFKPKEADA